LSLLRRILGKTDMPMSGGEIALLYGGIFFTFAGAGWIMATAMSEPMFGIGGGVYSASIAGLSSCLWAHCFIAKRFWLLPLVLLWQVFAPKWIADHIAVPTGLFEWGIHESTRHKATVLSAAAIISIVLGYICGVRFTGKLERRTVRAQAELDVAKRVHESLVPPIRLRAEGVEVLGVSRASAEMGGDLVDVVRTRSCTDLILADVSGHGVGAGIVMGMLKSAARTLLRREMALPELLAELNSVLAELVSPGMFATAGVVRVRDGASIEYALAGHLPIFHFEAASGAIRDLPNESLPLAVDGLERFRSGTLAASPGDTFLLFTDGLTEVMDARGRQLGLGAFRDAYAAAARGPLDAIASTLFARTAGHGPQNDDQSIILIRVC